jgi:hypothetical protein
MPYSAGAIKQIKRRKMLPEELTKLSEMSEAELRAYELSFPKTLEEVNQIIEALTNRQHDYGTCVYAMSIAAIAAMNYVATTLGVTGFQASCADLDVIRRNRLLDCPFAIITADNLLFPQYDIRAKVEELLSSWQGWASEQAREKLTTVDHAHPDVIEHWKRLSEVNQKEEAN